MNAISLLLAGGAVFALNSQALLVPQIPFQPPAASTKIRLDLAADREKFDELEQRADAAYTTGDLQTAIALYRRAVVIAEAIGDDVRIAISTGKLAVALAEQGRLAEAHLESLKAISYYRKLPQPDINHAALLHNSGWVSAELGRTDEAARWYKQAIDHYGKIEGSIARVLGAMSQRRLAKLYLQQGHARLAVLHYKECLRACEKYLQPYDPMVLAVRLELRAARQAIAHEKGSSW